MKTPDTSLPDDDYTFNTLGTSIDDAFGDYQEEEDSDECVEDDYSEEDYE